MEELIKRLDTEFFELKEKLDKLNTFIYNNENFYKIAKPHQILLVSQHKAMQDYYHILFVRITLLETEFKVSKYGE